MIGELKYRRWSFKHGGTPLKIISDKFNFPRDSQGQLIIPQNDILVKIHYASINPIDSKLHHIISCILLPLSIMV